MRTRLFGGVTGVAAAVWVAALHAAPLARPPQGSELPPGEGRDTVVTMCSDCHEVEIIPAQRRSRVEWRDLVEEMAARGSAATDDDIRVIVDYVVTQFGRVNVNRAAEDDLVRIVDLTRSEAAAIVDYRQREGEFRTLDDLRKVPGLEFARIQERKDRIAFSGS